MLAVFVFMALYYQAFGLVADVVLLANVILLTALLSMLRASLSLPGIAGIILTVGIAVDANVLIYERIREELRNGVSPQAAIRAGFDKAFSAIADSNVTTLIAGLVLWVIGTGAIRGFRDRADARHRHLDVHLAAGQPRADHADVRRPAQGRAAVDRLTAHAAASAARTRIGTPWNSFIARPAFRSCPHARCGTGCRSS